MAIHTYVHRRDRCCFTFPGGPMAEEATDLVDACMYFMRIIDRLYRLIPFLSSESYTTHGNKITTHYKKENGEYSDICFVPIEGNRFGPGNTFCIITQFFQVTVHLH